MEGTVATELKRTPLYGAHTVAGARMVPFAGWEMPVQYGGVKQEHLAVRSGAGIFDVSHMGQLETSGALALGFLQSSLSNNLEKVPLWGAQYALLCHQDGGVIDDLITYRLPGGDSGEHFLTVVNAANREIDLETLRERASRWQGVEVADRSGDYAMIALQGPQALTLLEEVWEGGDPGKLARFTAMMAMVAGEVSLVARTGYTGEDGVEILPSPEGAAAIWRALLEAGAMPCGLGARDTLRLEACYPLYGNELSGERTPIEAGLKWCCDLEKEFVGVERMREQASEGTAQKLAAFVIDGPGIPRKGCTVVAAGEVVGEVTSGTYSPTLEKGVGMAYVASGLAEPGTEIAVDVRGKMRAAHIESKPLYGGGIA